MNLYDFKVLRAGECESLRVYQGKVLLIVNTASRCGLTGQYTALNNLYRQYHAQGFDILDFPCNQFRHQAPERNEEYAQICQTKFGVQFPIFDKIDVNGEHAAPLYVYLKQQQPKDQSYSKIKDLFLRLATFGSHYSGSDIQWNFTKFLVNRQGEVVARFSPCTEPAQLTAAIEAWL